MTSLRFMQPHRQPGAGPRVVGLRRPAFARTLLALSVVFANVYLSAAAAKLAWGGNGGVAVVGVLAGILLTVILPPRAK